MAFCGRAGEGCWLPEPHCRLPDCRSPPDPGAAGLTGAPHQSAQKLLQGGSWEAPCATQHGKDRKQHLHRAPVAGAGGMRAAPLRAGPPASRPLVLTLPHQGGVHPVDQSLEGLHHSLWTPVWPMTRGPFQQITSSRSIGYSP